MALDPVSAALDIGGKLIDRLWPDPQQRDAAKLQLFQMQQAGELAELTAETDLAKGQIETNTAEAANSSLFVSGWRPFIGWVCGLSFANQFFVGPLLTYCSTLYTGHAVPWPTLDTTTMMPLLMGMLGLGGLRTYEKLSNVARN